MAIVPLVLAPPAHCQIAVQELEPSPTEPVTIAADSVRNWTENDVRVLVLTGNVYIAQGLTRIRAPHAVAWVHEHAAGTNSLTRIEVYAEGGVRHDAPSGSRATETLSKTLETKASLSVRMKERLHGPAVDVPVYQHALARRSGKEAADEPVQQAAFQGAPPLLGLGEGGRERRIRFFTRTVRPFQAEAFRVSEEEEAVVVTGGIIVLIEDAAGVGTVDIATDRMVLWTRTLDAQAMDKGEATQSADTPLEIYMEGNVVIYQGPRKFECAQMYYDVNRSLAVAIDTEMEAMHERLVTPVIFRARKLRQVSKDKFFAEGTQITPSPFASPGYDLETRFVTLEGLPASGSDPATGEAASTRNRVTGTHNIFHIEQIPVFYWPYAQTTLEDMRVPLRKLALRHSRAYGFQVETTWDMHQLLGWDRPEHHEWDLNLDYFTKRGPAAGTVYEYRGEELLGIEGRYNGLLDTWWIHDTGKDRLGDGRKNIEPEEHTRGRFLFRHRHQLPHDFTLALEVGWITDVNFLEQFFEKEFEEDKDQETLVYLKQQRDNWAWSALARGRILDFVTSTDYLPQLDFYLLGEPLLGEWLTYHTHSSIGYLGLHDSDRSFGDIHPAPFGDDGPAFVGGRFDTLHELDLPLNAGPVRFVPYAVGRFSGWTETLDEDDGARAYGAVGSRASIPFWRVFPCVESDLWNVHGLAHKIVFSLDYSIGESNLDHRELPLYDELEEDAEQVFRRRFLFRDFGSPPGVAPPGLDPQIYAIRRGLTTSTETVDDLYVMRFDVRQRLQTKRGMPGQRHIIDWMTLQSGIAWFPNEDDQNFGEDFGLITYDYAWHVGDRTSILADGWFETYDDGPRTWSAGVYVDRPPRGSFYAGFRWIEPIDSRVARFSYNYWMSPKWISSLSTQFDFGERRNLGQTLVLTRIGSDIVFRLGLSFNPLEDNYSVGVEIQPRVDQSLRLGSIRGGHVPLEFAPVE